MEQGGRVVIVAITLLGIEVALAWAWRDPEPRLRHGAVLLTANLTAGLWIASMLGNTACRRPNRPAQPDLPKTCYTAGVVMCWVHIPLSFHLAHQWSLRAAMAHVAEADGTGYGILASFAFLLMWTADATWWWLAPAGYEQRPRWLRWLVHGFLAFVVFNATVLYGGDLSRWTFAVLFALVAAMIGRRWSSR